MGRAQQTRMPTDHFATVFGERRGSRTAQAARDRKEALTHIGGRLVRGRWLEPKDLEEFHTYFASEDPVVRVALREALYVTMRSDGLGAAATALAYPTVTELPEGVADLLRVLVTERVGEITGESKSQPDLSDIDNLGERVLSYRQSPFPLALAHKNQGIIQAVADFYGGLALSAGETSDVLMIVASQPDSHLPLYRPLLDVVVLTAKGEASEVALGSIALALSGAEHNATPARRAFFSSLREVLERRKTLSPLEMAVLLHPVWGDEDFVTKEDVISNAGFSLPGGLRGIQRILVSLMNGGKDGSGGQYITYCPQATQGKKDAYILSDLGRRARAEMASQ